MVTTKREQSKVSVNYPSSEENSVFREVSLYQNLFNFNLIVKGLNPGVINLIVTQVSGVGGGRLFEAGDLLFFSAFGMGAYSSWVLI